MRRRSVIAPTFASATFRSRSSIRSAPHPALIPSLPLPLQCRQLQMLRLVSWPAIDLYGKSLVCLPANSMASCSPPRPPTRGTWVPLSIAICYLCSQCAVGAVRSICCCCSSTGSGGRRCCCCCCCLGLPCVIQSKDSA